MWPISVLMGLVAGVAGGFFGIGGGSILIPAMIYIFGMNQHQAQGTTLAAMIPPIGILAAWTYYKHGDVNVPMAACIALGFVLGGLIGAHYALKLPVNVLKKCFAVFFLLIALKMLFEK